MQVRWYEYENGMTVLQYFVAVGEQTGDRLDGYWIDVPTIYESDES